MGIFNLFSSQRKPSGQSTQYETQTQPALFNNLSQPQKFAMVTMLVSLAAAPTSAERKALAQRMMFTDASMLGITEDMMLNYTQTQIKPSPESLISTLRTVTDTNVLEWLIYCGYGIITVNQNEKACSVFFDWWKQLGYTPEEINHVIKKIEDICNRMR